MDQFMLGSRYYYTRLSDFEKKVYREIYACWVTGNSAAKIQLPGTGFTLPSGIELHQIVTYIIDENPHLFHLETSQFNYSRFGNRVTIQAENVYTPDEYKDIYQRLIARVNQITGKARRYKSDYDKLRFLHDYLAENLTYDMGAPDPRSQRETHTIVGALLNSACVCDGYARAYRLMCDQLHLSCIVAIGESAQPGNEGPHAWNFVRINGQVYHVDVTWDSNLIASGCPVSDYYFLRNDAVFSKDHAWDPLLYPPIKTGYPRTDRVISSKWELEQHLCERVKAGDKTILVQFNNSFPGLDTFQRLIKDIVKRNPSVFLRVKSYESTYYENIKYAEIRFE